VEGCSVERVKASSQEDGQEKGGTGVGRGAGEPVPKRNLTSCKGKAKNNKICIEFGCI
jgi:hypothetical protein